MVYKINKFEASSLLHDAFIQEKGVKRGRFNKANDELITQTEKEIIKIVTSTLFTFEGKRVSLEQIHEIASKVRKEKTTESNSSAEHVRNTPTMTNSSKRARDDASTDYSESLHRQPHKRQSLRNEGLAIQVSEKNTGNLGANNLVLKSPRARKLDLLKKERVELAARISKKTIVLTNLGLILGKSIDLSPNSIKNPNCQRKARKGAIIDRLSPEMKLDYQIKGAQAYIEKLKSRESILEKTITELQAELSKVQQIDLESANDMSSQELIPPAMTPPAMTPPAMTPPAMTPPAMTPPAMTPPAMTPPARKKPETKEEVIQSLKSLGIPPVIW